MIRRAHNCHCDKENERGATILEFAITILLFFFLILSTIEAAELGFRALTAQYIASSGVRQAILGTQTMAQLKQHVFDLGDALNVPVEMGNISICGTEDLNPDGTCAVQNLGRPERYVVVRVVVPTSFLLGAITIDLVGEAAGRNER